MKIIDGRALAEKIKDNLVKEILELKDDRPNLAIVLIGEREDSRIYVSLKEKEAKKVGIDTHLYKCPASITTEEVISMIDYLNNDEMIDAILVQLPLPEGQDTDKIIAAINPEKDVDMFHPENFRILMNTCNHQHVMPPVYEAVLYILREINFDPRDKEVFILANSDLFGQGLAKVLECLGAHVVTGRYNDHDLPVVSARADLLITALGQANYVKKEMIKEGAAVIDIGIAKENGKLFGDVDMEDVKEKVGYITPVPGGVGPLTIAMAFQNTIELYKKNRSSNK